MADEATPALGGVFRDGQGTEAELRPLDDPTYRNVLLCRAYCINQAVFSIDVIYEAINILLGQTPNYMKFIETQHKIWTLELNSNTMTTSQRDLILATHHWYIPMTVGFNISMVGGLFDVTYLGDDITHNAVQVTHTA